MIKPRSIEDESCQPCINCYTGDISSSKLHSSKLCFNFNDNRIHDSVGTANQVRVTANHRNNIIYIYNIAFVNSECWLAKSRIDITQCQHGNVGKCLSLCFFVLCSKTIIKHFSVLIYSSINTRGISGVVFPHNFSFSQFPLVL
jgi:hypothetical protein